MNTAYDFRNLAVWTTDDTETVIWFHNISSYMTRNVDRWEYNSLLFKRLKRAESRNK